MLREQHFLELAGRFVLGQQMDVVVTVRIFGCDERNRQRPLHDGRIAGDAVDFLEPVQGRGGLCVDIETGLRRSMFPIEAKLARKGPDMQPPWISLEPFIGFPYQLPRNFAASASRLRPARSGLLYRIRGREKMRDRRPHLQFPADFRI